MLEARNASQLLGHDLHDFEILNVIDFLKTSRGCRGEACRIRIFTTCGILQHNPAVGYDLTSL